MAQRVELFETESGRTPVMDYIDEAPKRDRAQILSALEELEGKGFVLLGSHLMSQVTRRIYELRVKGEQLHRLLFFHAARFGFVVVHAFAKKTNKTPAREIALAEQRMATWIARKERTEE